jgi:hypothetical protein
MKMRLFLLLVIFAASSCKLNKEAEKVVIKDYFIVNELLGQMNDLEEIAEVEKKFSKQGLKVVDEVAPWLKMVKMEYDTSSIEPKKMMAKLKLSGYFRELEFNKKVTQRGN